MTNVRKIGIIGIGPRGGYAFERLIFELAKKNGLSKIHISLFEATGNFGNGQVYNLNQISTNWINIPERKLIINKRKELDANLFKIDSFPSYHEWVNKDFNAASEEEIDMYPPRSQLGAYLSQRFQSFIDPLIQSNIASLYEEQVTEVKWLKNNKLQIFTHSNSYGEFDELLLTIGHQPTELSQQVIDWEEHASNKENIFLFKAPYPVVGYLSHEALNVNSTIGIRGFGLTMIDVVRAIAEKYGQFITQNEKNLSCTYLSEGTIRNILVPFSLDGQPPVPKPINARLDEWFKPSETQILNLQKYIGNRKIQNEADSPQFLIEAFAPIAATIYSALTTSNNFQNLTIKDIEILVIQFQVDQGYEHPTIISKKQSAKKSMQDFVGMATGEKPISLDYCIGQVWRHCLRAIHSSLSFSECSDNVLVEVIELIEWMKRYSYGPPVESIQQLLALVEAGALNLDLVKNPEIELTAEGWRLHALGKSITVSLMIDSVLDPPKIKSVTSPIVKKMLESDLMMMVHDDLGVTTDETGYLISKNGHKKIPVALLGRLAKGTIVEPDSILDCFRSRPRQWAKLAADNHIDWLNEN